MSTALKAIALISGGLDSTLAARLIQGLGIELVALNTVSPFCLCAKHSGNGCMHSARSVAAGLGLKLISVDVGKEFLEIVKKPKHGYGSNMNPCIDCRILLFSKAKELMRQEGASFVVTGEVLGQRPMSQRKDAMLLIDREAGLSGLVLRPLSAAVLGPTIPEKEGLIRRDKLLAISGRARKEQFALAEKFGIKDFPCPSGGCLLTDPEFSRRLKDLMRYSELTADNIQLLKLGRHFRLDDKAKLVVGRNEQENQRLLELAREGDYLFTPDENSAGPTSLGRGDFNPDLIRLSGRLAWRYCDKAGSPSGAIFYRKFPGGEEKKLEALPLGEPQLMELRI